MCPKNRSKKILATTLIASTTMFYGVPFAALAEDQAKPIVENTVQDTRQEFKNWFKPWFNDTLASLNVEGTTCKDAFNEQETNTVTENDLKGAINFDKAAIEDKIAEAQTALKQLDAIKVKEQKKVLVTKTKEYNEKVAALKTANDNLAEILKAENGSLAKQKKAVNDQLAVLDNDNKDALGKKQIVTAQKAEVDKKLGDVNDILTNVENLSPVSRVELTAYQEKVDNESKKLAGYLTEIDAQINKLKEYQATLVADEAALGEYKTALNDYSTKLNEYKTALTDYETYLTDAENGLAKQKTDIKAYITKLNNVKELGTIEQKLVNQAIKDHLDDDYKKGIYNDEVVYDEMDKHFRDDFYKHRENVNVKKDEVALADWMTNSFDDWFDGFLSGWDKTKDAIEDAKDEKIAKADYEEHKKHPNKAKQWNKYLRDYEGLELAPYILAGGAIDDAFKNEFREDFFDEFMEDITEKEDGKVENKTWDDVFADTFEDTDDFIGTSVDLTLPDQANLEIPAMPEFDLTIPDVVDLSLTDVTVAIKDYTFATIENVPGYSIEGELVFPEGPEVTDPDPEVTDPDPEITDPDPEITDPDPEVTDPDPEVTDPDPEVTDPDPEVTDPDPDKGGTEIEDPNAGGNEKPVPPTNPEQPVRPTVPDKGGVDIDHNNIGGNDGNELDNVPKTGDESNTGLWGMLSALSFGALGGLFLGKRKKDEEQA